jgi:hypothetical protein
LGNGFQEVIDQRAFGKGVYLVRDKVSQGI